jgi:opacity protein-like surface antigen
VVGRSNASQADAVIATDTRENARLSGFYFGGSTLVGTGSDIEGGQDIWRRSEEGFDPNKFQLGAFAGYNVMYGSLLLGAELDVRASTDNSTVGTQSDRIETVYPAFSQSSSGSFQDAGRPPVLGTMEGGQQVYDFKTSYEYKETVAPTLSVRVGHQFNDFLLYGRIGAGIALIEESFAEDDTGSVYCTQETTRQDFTQSGSYTIHRTGCLNPYSGARKVKTEDSIKPTATLAVGAEYNFDRVFVRGEGEMRHMFLDDKLMFSPSDGATRYAISTSIGLRF